MPTDYQVQIEAQEAIIQERTTGGSCSLTTCNTDITSAKTEIASLKALKFADGGYFMNKAMFVKFAAPNVPLLATKDQTIIREMANSGKKIIEFGAVTITSAGSEIQIKETTGTPTLDGLVAFVQANQIEVTNVEASAEIAKLTVQREALIAQITAREEAITLLNASETVPAVPVLGVPVLSVNAFEATVTFAATGTGPITYTMDWGDGSAVGAVTSPSTHTYGTNDIYEAVLTATNTIGSTTENVEVTINVVPGVAPGVTGVSATPNGMAADIVATVSGDLPISYTVSWGDSEADTTGTITTEPERALTANHTYSLNGEYTVTVSATNTSGTNSDTATVTIS